MFELYSTESTCSHNHFGTFFSGIAERLFICMKYTKCDLLHLIKLVIAVNKLDWYEKKLFEENVSNVSVIKNNVIVHCNTKLAEMTHTLFINLRRNNVLRCI